MYDLFMTETREKLLQMFILGLEGESLENNINLINTLEMGLGGVIFFTQNITSIEQSQKLIKEIKKIAKISPFLSIDQEGGRVERTENIFSGKHFLSPRFAVQKGENFVKKQTSDIAKLLLKFGINLNFAPVLDVNTNPNNPIIGERAFSSDTDEVIKFGKIVVDTYIENNIIPCTKHFPGHGDACIDSHISLPEFNIPLEEMERTHIRTFKEVQSPMIMVAHMHCLAFDKDRIPSSLSKNVISYLRENHKFDGLIITDDMVMGGVLDIDGAKACEKAIKAGVNILLYRNSVDETIRIIEKLADIAQNDEELKKKINTSYKKIINFKKKYKIISG